MCDELIKVVDKRISRQKTIELDNTLILLDVLTKVIKVLTCLQVMSLRATEHRELCRLTGRNRAFHDTPRGYGSALKGGKRLTTEYFQGKGKFVGIGLCLTIDSHWICNCYICHVCFSFSL